MPELAYVNGVYGPIHEAKVSIEDRGFQFGDGIYEVVVAYQGRPWLLDAHLQRMRRSAQAIELAYDFDAHPIAPIIVEGLRRSGLSDALIYIQLTRGAAPRSHLIPDDIVPTLVMTFRPLVPIPDELRNRGARIITVPDTRWANCFIKSVMLLPNVLARHEARRRGFDDALFVTETGEVRECTSSNIFLARNRRLLFPPRTHAVLHGCTQGFLLECAASIELPVEEDVITLDTLLSANEVFISSTSVDVLGVTQINTQVIGDGRVGPLTRKLYQTFHDKKQTACSLE